MFSRIRDYFDHPYRVLAWLLVVSALTMMLLIIGATQALAANITGTFTYPTKFVDGTPLTLAQIERMRIEYGSCAGSAFGAKEGEVVVTPPALEVPHVAQRTAAQVAAEMAAYDRVRVTRERADLAEREARRARMDISRLRAELPARRRAASMRAIEQMLGKL